MKKEVLFVIESLGIGGAEKSLATLLNLLDYSKYNVDLQLFVRGGEFETLLPDKVNVLPQLLYFQHKGSLFEEIINIRTLYDIKCLIARIKYSIWLRTEKTNITNDAVKLWTCAQGCFEQTEKEYDVAIAYAQGVPTFYVADKVRAKKKLAWVNSIYESTGKYFDFIKAHYEKIDLINGVSQPVVEQVANSYAISDQRMLEIRDILDEEFARKMANMKSDVKQEMSGKGYRILTVGRFCGMKSYDLAVDTAKILKEKGLEFTWYSVGDGVLKKKVEKQIIQNGLENEFILLGAKSNPYPYFKECDIYVQTSRHEGFGITLSEAKMFHKPIVTTNFSAAYMQIENERTGLLVDTTPHSIAEGIIRMINDCELREACIKNVSLEIIGNAEEINKLYKVIE